MFVLVAGALCSLGVWQIERGENKNLMLAQRKAASKSTPAPFMDAAADMGDGRPRYGHRYTVTGRVDAGHQILLDNQVFQQRVGYQVWTPVILNDGRRVLVDRGWVALGPNGRGDPPSPDTPTGRVTMTGLWRSLPEPGLRLSAGDVCKLSRWPRVLNYPNVAEIRCQYGGPVANGLLLLGKADPRGFPRDWQAGLMRMPPVRHFGYALQWFAMAIAVAVLFVAVNLKSSRSQNR